MFGLKKKEAEAKPGVLERLRRGLEKTRAGLFYDLGDLFRSKGEIDTELLEEIEARLLMADVGVESTRKITDALSEQVNKKSLTDPEALFTILHEQMMLLLQEADRPLVITPENKKPFVLLVVGVNGVGKTTTIGKLSYYYSNNGYSVLLAAGDTFRAAAIEQIQTWAEKSSVPVIAQKSGSDSAAVIYDALQSARAHGSDIVIADTAGRLHNKSNLMEELKKIRRTIDKFDAEIQVEVMLVLDAGTGQNALSQAKEFNDAIGVDSLTLTKLDGTAKGGVVFALAQSLATPIRFIGVGEQADDLRPFNADNFVTALLSVEP